MKIVLEELEQIQAKLLLIDARLAAMMSAESSSDSIELLDKAYALLQQELIEIHKLEKVVNTRKITLLERRLNLTPAQPAQS